MGQEKLSEKDISWLKKFIAHEYPLYKGTRDDRSNLELIHNRTVSQSSRYAQSGTAIIVAGIAFAAFLFVFLEKKFGIDTCASFWAILLVVSVIFVVSVILSFRRFFEAWACYVDAEFMERELGTRVTWEKYGLNKKLRQFRGEKRFFRKKIKYRST